MEKLVQFSIFLANKPGVLSSLYRELAKAKINVTGIALMDSMEHGVLRLMVEDPIGARAVFRQMSVPVSESDVLGVTLANRPGAAADLCDRLADAHIPIGYMYCTTGARGGKTTAVIKVPDINKAIRVLDSTRDKRRDMKLKLRRPSNNNHRR